MNDPVDPVGLVDPVDPVHPVDPVDPVDPLDPVDLADPVDLVYREIKKIGKPITGKMKNWETGIPSN